MTTVQDCVEFVNENPICHLATMEGDQPRVRAFSCWFADDTGFYFQTVSMKEMSNHMANNPKVELCFIGNNNMLGPMLRITGEVEFMDDIQLRERVLADRSYLKDFGVSARSRELLIFRICHGQAYFWSLIQIEDSLRPKEIIYF